MSRADWRAEVEAVRSVLQQAGRPLGIDELEPAVPHLDRYQLRNRLGHWIRRGWIVAQRAVNNRLRYVHGGEMDDLSQRFMTAQFWEPADRHAKRLRRLARRFRREARTLDGVDYADAQGAARALDELAAEWDEAAAREVA